MQLGRDVFTDLLYWKDIVWFVMFNKIINIMYNRTQFAKNFIIFLSIFFQFQAMNFVETKVVFKVHWKHYSKTQVNNLTVAW